MKNKNEEVTLFTPKNEIVQNLISPIINCCRLKLIPKT